MLPGRQERLVIKGRLVEKRLELRNLELSIQGDISAIRGMLPPFEPIIEIKADVVAAQAVEMAGKHAEYAGLLKDVDAMERALR
ncbi:MAG: hypothetical protein WC340_16570 [Kiritimatiellia bacterium]